MVRQTHGEREDIDRQGRQCVRLSPTKKEEWGRMEGGCTNQPPHVCGYDLQAHSLLRGTRGQQLTHPSRARSEGGTHVLRRKGKSDTAQHSTAQHIAPISRQAGRQTDSERRIDDMHTLWTPVDDEMREEDEEGRGGEGGLPPSLPVLDRQER